MYTTGNHRSGRTALALATMVGLMVATAGASAVAVEPVDGEMPLEPPDQQVGVSLELPAALVVDPIPEDWARAVELFRMAEHGFDWQQAIADEAAEKRARALERFRMAEHGFEWQQAIADE